MTRQVVTIRIILVWLWVWPLVTGVLIGFRKTGLALPLHYQTLVLSAFLVPLISLVLAPAMHRLATVIVKERQ